MIENLENLRTWEPSWIATSQHVEFEDWTNWRRRRTVINRTMRERATIRQSTIAPDAQSIPSLALRPQSWPLSEYSTARELNIEHRTRRVATCGQFPIVGIPTPSSHQQGSLSGICSSNVFLGLATRSETSSFSVSVRRQYRKSENSRIIRAH